MVQRDVLAGPPDVEAGHERRDIDFKKIVYSGLGLLAVFLLALAIALYFFGFLSRWTASSDKSERRPESSAPAISIAPLDKTSTGEELRELREEEDQLIRGYGWVNRESGIVRIPVDCDQKPCRGITAIDLLLQRGIPAQRGPEAAPAASGAEGRRGDIIKGESNGWSEGGAP